MSVATGPASGHGAPAAATRAGHVYDRLRGDLLAGRLRPGRKLSMRFLMETYDIGQTPLREALNRLTSDGLVECREQRGFLVSGISQSELIELTKTRCWVEGLAVRESIADATPAWEEDLVLAHHRLARTPRSLDPHRFEDNPEWERLHRAFHRAVLARCGSRPLLGFCDELADQLYRYRQLSIRKAFTTRPVGDEHRAILDAILAADADGASALLTAHYRRTADVILGDAAIFAAT